MWVKSFTSHTLLKICASFNLDILLVKSWNGKIPSQLSHAIVFPGDIVD